MGTPIVIYPFDSWEARERDIFLTTGKRLFDVEIQSDEPGPGTRFFDDFFKNAELAGRGLGHAGVERLQAASAELDKRVSTAFTKIAADSEKQAREATAWMNPGGDKFEQRSSIEPDDALAKVLSMSALQRRRAALEHFVRKSLAGGETIESIVDYARRLDPETANLLQEIGDTFVKTAKTKLACSKTAVVGTGKLLRVIGRGEVK